VVPVGPDLAAARRVAAARLDAVAGDLVALVRS